jgi:hypothetical protein
MRHVVFASLATCPGRCECAAHTGSLLLTLIFIVSVDACLLKRSSVFSCLHQVPQVLPGP